MGKKIKEFVTHWGPSITDWGDGTEQRFVIERDEDVSLVFEGTDVLVAHPNPVEGMFPHDVRVVFDVRVDTEPCPAARLGEDFG